MLRLTVLSGARTGWRLELAKPLIRLGRAPDNDIAFDPNVDLDSSAYHAEIRAENGQYVVYDGNSRNGLFLANANMQRIQRHVLNHGDQIQFGNQGPRVAVEVLAAPTNVGGTQPAVPSYGAAPGAPPGAPPGYGAPANVAPAMPTGGQPQLPPMGAPAGAPPGAGASPQQPPVGGKPKMGQQTLLAHVGAMIQQQNAQGGGKKGKSTLEIRAMVDQNVSKATGKLKAIIAVLVVIALAGAGVAIYFSVRTSQQTAELKEDLNKQIDSLDMNDPKRLALEKKLAEKTGSNSEVGRSIYEKNKNALYMLTSHKRDSAGFCTGFAVKKRMIASNAHCAVAADGLEDSGATIWAHLNDSTKGGVPKMVRIKRFGRHPKYEHKNTGKELTPDVGLFEVEEDLPNHVDIADAAALKKMGTGDELFIIGFPGRTMDADSPVAVFMFSHVGRITDASGQRAGSFDQGWLVQHEGQTTPGTSGSPIFNSDGKVVAINAGGLVEQNKQVVYRYAMRIDLLQSVKLGGEKKKDKDDDDSERPKKKGDDEDEKPKPKPKSDDDE